MQRTRWLGLTKKVSAVIALSIVALASIFIPGSAHAATQTHAFASHYASIGTSNVGPSVTASCYNPNHGSNDIFAAFLGTDNQINIDDITANDNIPTGEHSPYTPQLACWENNLVVAWVPTDGSPINTGIFPCNILGCGHGGRLIGDKSSWSNVYSNDAPTFTSDGGKMYLGWVGTDSAHHLNLLELADTSHAASGIIKFTDYTQHGASLCFYWDGGVSKLYVSFIDAGSSQRIHLGIFNGSNQLTAAAGSPFIDSSPTAAGIFANHGKIDFIWRGSGGNNHVWTDYWDGSWHSHIQQTDTTIGAPGIDGYGTPPTAHTYTVFTGTNNVVYFDVNAYSY